jgi:hypothetical protein
MLTFARQARKSMMAKFDLLINNAEIHDGVGGDPIRGSVAVACVGEGTGRP